jgi:hypothetical protein
MCSNIYIEIVHVCVYVHIHSLGWLIKHGLDPFAVHVSAHVGHAFCSKDTTLSKVVKEPQVCSKDTTE